MRKWLAKGHPESFWLSGFFFPHGFMTGVLQTYARKHGKAIDFLKFKFRFVDGREQIHRAPDDGVYIYGLFVESAKWCHQS
jgi:dynein heavy chain